jgi:peptidyl-prolyl cis-trans isomerase SurA
VACVASLLVGARAHQAVPRAQAAALKPGGPAAATATPADNSRGVAATVNDLIISDYDLNQRMTLFMAQSGVRPTDEQKKRIREQVLRGLVDETLQLAEAQKNKITVLKDEVDKALESIAKQNGATAAQIEQMLTAVGVNISTLRTQITAEIAWQKLMQNEMGGRVQISDEDVDTELKRIAESAHKSQFLVSEIFVGVDSPQDDEKVKTGVAQIMQQLNLGANFPAAARQFSQSPSAASGGDIGWVQEGQLAPELDKALVAMKGMGHAGPIHVAGGYYILQVRDRREPAGTVVPKSEQPRTGLPDGPLPLARVLLALPAKPSAELKEKAIQFAQELASHINGCGNLGTMAKQIQGAIYMNLGSLRAGQMSQDLRNALATTQPGDVAKPFISSAGVEIIVRCDPKVQKVVAFQMPTRQDIQNRLYQEQMSMMSRRYLRDLRRDSVVEYR